VKGDTKEAELAKLPKQNERAKELRAERAKEERKAPASGSFKSSSTGYSNL
jgi:hypothetical protein